MQRSELEHLIRASGEIAQDDEIIIIGSQAILGQYPDAPARLLVSMEADIYPKNYPEAAERVDGAIGEASSFHELKARGSTSFTRRLDVTTQPLAKVRQSSGQVLLHHPLR